MRGLAFAAIVAFSTSSAILHAQEDDRFGTQSRADSARQMIVLAVQQGISSLPPTSSQSLFYEYDPATDTYTISSLLGPTVLRSTQTIGDRNFSARVAFSYFELSETFGPADYKVTGDPFPDPPSSCTQFGLSASSNVALLSFAATYGITRKAEITLNVPVVVSDTQASERYLGNDGEIVPQQCAALRLASPQLTEVPFSQIALSGGQRVGFNDGTNAGLGRITLGGKLTVYEDQRFGLAFSPEFNMPSPNEDEFAGSSSASILPRLIGQATLDYFRLYADVGYEYDFDFDELSRFAWTAGVSVPLRSPQLTIDLGAAGSLFNEGISWTPSRATFVDGGTVGHMRALSETTLGTDFVDLVAGLKFRLPLHLVASLAITAPVNNEGFRTAIVGTAALEYYLVPQHAEAQPPP